MPWNLWILVVFRKCRPHHICTRKMKPKNRNPGRHGTDPAREGDPVREPQSIPSGRLLKLVEEEPLCEMCKQLFWAAVRERGCIP